MKKKKKIDLEKIFLYIGNDIDKFNTFKVKELSFKDIIYYEIGEERLILNEKKEIICSCKYKFCWHYFKLKSEI